MNLIAVWGVVGVSLILGQAIVRLLPHALDPWRGAGMTGVQTGLYLTWALLNWYAEGVRGFQQRFCPRVVTRATELSRQANWVGAALAPAYCMGLIQAPRRRLITSWSLVLVLVAVVWLVRRIEQPWRGIIDGGVVIGLLWGVGALWVLFARAWWMARRAPHS